MKATPIPPGTFYVPSRIVVDVNVLWLVFLLEGDMYEAYRNMPQLLEYDSKTLLKMSWNSDNGTCCYKQINPAELARKA